MARKGSELQDWIAESKFAWGEQRESGSMAICSDGNQMNLGDIWSEVAAHGLSHDGSSPSHRIVIKEFSEPRRRPRPERNVCQLRFLQGRGVASMGDRHGKQRYLGTVELIRRPLESLLARSYGRRWHRNRPPLLGKTSSRRSGDTRLSLLALTQNDNWSVATDLFGSDTIKGELRSVPIRFSASAVKPHSRSGRCSAASPESYPKAS